MSSRRDDFGDRMKDYERRETDRHLLPLIPIYARVDGRSFSKFTHGMERPYDLRLSECMIQTTEWLVAEANANLGYTQSDEISLVWYQPDPTSQTFFNGKLSKLHSVLAAMTTAKFTSLAVKHWPDRVAKLLPHFDARIINLPTLIETANMILWRERDATRNSIEMAGRHYYSSKQLFKKNCRVIQEMLFEKGVNWNNYPAFFKRGTFVQKRRVVKELDATVLSKIPEKHRPVGPIERWEIVRLDMPSFATVTNRVEVIFDGADPVVLTKDK